MKKALFFLKVLVSLAFAIQSLVVSFAMISKQLTVPFLIPSVTVFAGWVTLVLMSLTILVLIFRSLAR